MSVVPISTDANSMPFRREMNNMKGNGSIGNVVTMGEFPLYGCTNIQRKHYGESQSRFLWDEEIRNLMEDFRIPTDMINKIIRATETECKNKTSRQKYDHAWRKFWALIG